MSLPAAHGQQGDDDAERYLKARLLGEGKYGAVFDEAIDSKSSQASPSCCVVVLSIVKASLEAGARTNPRAPLSKIKLGIGSVWHVQLVKWKGRVYVTHRWDRFAEANEGDILVFTCISDAAMETSIFGRHGCEKMAD